MPIIFDFSFSGKNVGIWGGKGQGKTFQTELIFRAMGVEPVIMSAGELESERAGQL
jgi:F0F1-type ATP synthase beta subunit